MTERDEYARLGYDFQEVVYRTAGGCEFTIHRPVGLPHNIPYCGRTVTVEELLAIWAHHSRPL